jgi:Fungal protein kinase
MLRKEGDKIYAVLNDFDLAVSADVQSTSSKHRTGTKPFMAIDLIHPDPTVHMYRHDLESMFYVLVWITSRFHNGQEIADPPLQEWADNSGATLLEKKSFFFMMSASPRRTQQFESFGPWVVSMKNMMQDGFLARERYISAVGLAKSRNSPPFEHDTLGGFVTFEKFQAVLDTELE